METKQEIRKRMLTVRDGLSPAYRKEAEQSIRNRLFIQREYQEAEAILCYVSFKSEVSTTEILRQALSEGKAVYCPRVTGEHMDFFAVQDLAELSVGYHGISEPSVHAKPFSPVDFHKVLVIMPGTAFDTKRNRIGYGGGYYDRFLAKYPAFQTAALAFKEQIITEIPAKPHDRKPELIICNAS